MPTRSKILLHQRAIPADALLFSNNSAETEKQENEISHSGNQKEIENRTRRPHLVAGTSEIAAEQLPCSPLLTPAEPPEALMARPWEPPPSPSSTVTIQRSRKSRAATAVRTHRDSAVPPEDACPCGATLGRRDVKAEGPPVRHGTGAGVTPTFTCWSPDPGANASRLPANCTRSLQLGGRALHEGGFAPRTPTPTPELSSNNQSPRKRVVALHRAPGRHGPQDSDAQGSAYDTPMADQETPRQDIQFSFSSDVEVGRAGWRERAAQGFCVGNDAADTPQESSPLLPSRVDSCSAKFG
ncbi:hypothetical protein R6Z07M_007335 [Ovis aries]